MNTSLEPKYSQLHDYISQVKGFSCKEGLPKITQKLVAERIGINSKTLSRFLNLHTRSPAKILKNFIKKYPAEYRKWPKGADKIYRLLQKNDVLYFLCLNTIIPPLILIVQKPKADPVRLVYHSETKALQFTRQPIAPVVISYRGHATDKDAFGMLYDHMTIQNSTRHPTMSSISANRVTVVEKLFRAVLTPHNAAFPFGGKNIPPTINRSYDGGLLVIPGRVRKVENEPDRQAHEYKIIRDALNRGQPMIGICAGAWRVWEQSLIWSRYPDLVAADPSKLFRFHDQLNTLADAKDHSYSRMLNLDKSGAKVIFNVQVHNIEIARNSLLESAMVSKHCKLPNTLTVNSVHWKAVNERQAPLNMRISAHSIQNPSILRKNRHGNVMGPQEGSAEAFENVKGAPIMGTQWHPEGYNQNDPSKLNSHFHINLLKYMTLAGDAYAAKRKCLRELKNFFSRKT